MYCSCGNLVECYNCYKCRFCCRSNYLTNPKKRRKPKKKKPFWDEIVIVRPPEDVDPRLIKQIEEQQRHQEAREFGPPRKSVPGVHLSQTEIQHAEKQAREIVKTIPRVRHYMEGGSGVTAYLWAKIGNKNLIVGSVGSSSIEDIVEAQRQIMEIPGITHAWHNLD